MSETLASPPDAERELPRVLGLFDAFMFVVGSIIGSGIFLKPGIAAQHLNSVGLILSVWVVVGLVTMCGCLAVAELAAMMPRAGGPYVYLRVAYGPRSAFLLGWTEFLVVRSGAVGALSVATAIYLNELVPMSEAIQASLAVGIVLGLGTISILGTRWAANVQNSTAVGKIVFLLFLVLLPFAAGEAKAVNFTPVWPSEWSPTLWSGLGIAMISVLWPYDGWVNVAPVAEEVRQPQRNVPLAMILGMTAVILLYVLANVAYLSVLGVEGVANSTAVASTMCQNVLRSDWGKVVAMGVAVSTFGAVNANLLAGPRIVFALARDRLLPAQFKEVHPRFQTPAYAIALQTVWAAMMIAAAYAWQGGPAEAFHAITELVIFGGSCFYALAVAAVYVLRRSQPHAERPYRTWGYPATPAIYLLFFGGALAAMLLNRPVQSIAGTGLIFIGLIYYEWAVRRLRGRGHVPQEWWHEEKGKQDAGPASP